MQRSSTSSKMRAKKRFGQNFLIDEGIIDEIIRAASIEDCDLILEIGPGRGALTKRFCDLAKRVIAIEIDWDLADLLREQYRQYDNFSVIQEDFLKLDLESLLSEEIKNCENVKVVANLPYYITTPIIMKLLESSIPIERIVVMVQKEVALRMCAQNGSSDYGALSLAVAFRSEPDIVTNVSADCFRPVPKVDSAVVRLMLKEPICEKAEEKMLFACVKAAFAQRRKTLINALTSAGLLDKEGCRDILTSLDWDINIRGERLSLEDFLSLARAVISKKEKD